MRMEHHLIDNRDLGAMCVLDRSNAAILGYYSLEMSVNYKNMSRSKVFIK